MSDSLKLSVHQLVDFLLRSGDIDNRVFNRSSMTEGARIHASYQGSQGADYLSEYPLSQTFYINEIAVTLEGRADGIIETKNGDFIIDEIKTTVIPLKDFKDQNLDWHLGQAKCYGLMFCLEKELKGIGIQLTYIRQGKEKDKMIESFTFIREELEQYVYSLLEDYLNFYAIILRNLNDRTSSINTLNFPFEKFRKGQRSLAKYSYSTVKSEGSLFVEAATGIGKTISILFPTIKTLGEDENSKLFYLTAKTSGKESAYKAIEILKESGLCLNDIIITAKEKICFTKKCKCNPDECPFAKDYYNKIQTVLRYALLNYTTFDYTRIVSLAKDYEICPFELELDLSLFCDVIVCDYNYMFDPISYMKRYFDEDSSHFVALIDEAHNLVDRSRDMYSASVSEYEFIEARRSLRNIKNIKIKNQLRKIKKLFEELHNQYSDEYMVVSDFSLETFKVFTSFTNAYNDISKENHDLITTELTNFYLDVNRFMKIWELFSDRYIAFYLNRHDLISLNLRCLDASKFLKSILERVKSSIFFSATLSPMDYYKDTLGGDVENDPQVILPSPFSINNFLIMVAPKVSIKYKDREVSYSYVVEYINSFIEAKAGNYFIYSPSYEYMEKLTSLYQNDNVDIFVQQKDMDDIEKEEFLKNFKAKPERTTLGFLVIGGTFSEGIDLPNDRLIGAVVIGIGLPKINFESDRIAEYYKKQDKPGHDYAYLYPGMNKVMQAVGRVIRSETDKGAVLLIDERYMNRQYQDLFRDEWRNYKVVFNADEIKEEIKNFYKK